MAIEIDSSDRRRRLKVRFPNQQAFSAALATQAPGLSTPVINPERLVISVSLQTMKSEISAEYVQDRLAALTEIYGAEVTEDFQFDLEEIFDPALFGPDTPTAPSLEDVLDAIRAPQAWSTTKGGGSTIAIVDTGINGTRGEFASKRRLGGWASAAIDPWTDYDGHGTMCGSIAAGSTSDGGVFNGVAPEAGILACRTLFYDTELTAIYQLLRDRANAGENIIASNSFGYRTGTPPPPPDLDFLAALDEAISAGVIVVFSAGNNHELAGGLGSSCAPNSVWGYKDRDDLLAVATCKMDQTMWEYSSRGPGEQPSSPGHNIKPDVTAPTPVKGRVLYQDKIVSLARGWGTSGACPQVAGLAALLRAKRPSASRTEIFDAILGTATSVGLARECGGAGLIDCERAVSAF